MSQVSPEVMEAGSALPGVRVNKISSTDLVGDVLEAQTYYGYFSLTIP